MLDLLHTWGPDNVGQLLVSTHEKRGKKEVADAIFNRIPTFEYLNTKGKIMLDGGASIVMPLEVARNTTAKFYDGYDLLDVTAQDNHTAAQYKWKQGAASVSISGREANIQNRGEAALMNLLNMKQKNAERSLRDIINQKLHGAANTAKDIQSLVTLIDATSTIGDINSTANTYWQAAVKTGGVFASQGVADWRNLYNTLKNRQGNPDMIITTQTIFEAYEATMAPQIRYTSMTTADARFRDLEFSGSKVRFDDQCASGVSYFLDSDAIQLFVSENVNFIYNDFVRPPDQDAKVAQFLVGLELATSNRRLLGKVTGQS
jgi:hypothetical protein